MRPLQQQTAEVLVKVLAVFTFFSAIICFLYAVIMLFFALSEPPDASFMAFAIIFFFVMLIMSVLLILLGRGLWRFRNWARITHIVLAWMGIVFTCLWVVMMLIGLNKGLAGTANTSTVPTLPIYIIMVVLFLLGLCYNGLILWLLQFEPTTRTLFLKNRKGAKGRGR